MEYALKSHVGHVRQVNEDYAYVSDLNGRVLAVLADGMGGHKAGEIASRLAVERIVKELSHLDTSLEDVDLREQLMQAVLLANREVYEYAQEHPECNGMGTTVVAALPDPAAAFAAAVVPLVCGALTFNGVFDPDDPCCGGVPIVILVPAGVTSGGSGTLDCGTGLPASTSFFAVERLSRQHSERTSFQQGEEPHALSSALCL